MSAAGRCDAVVLAGGTSRRMGGVDKTSLDVGGRAILDRVLLALREAGAGRCIVVGEPRQVVLDDVTWAREDPPGGGPVAGLAAGVQQVAAPETYVVAGDLPFLSGALLETLCDALEVAAAGVACAVAVDSTGRDQPLLGCWRTDALRAALPADPSGASMWRLLAPLEVVRLPVGMPLLDCDTPYELDLARAIAAREEGRT